MIWVIGGTTEARLLEEELIGKRDFIITIATKEGKDFLISQNVRIGRLDKEGMARLIDEEKITTIVDCSHPYAQIVSKNAREIACEKNIEYYRVKRPEVEYGDNIETFDTLEDLLERLSELDGVFLSTLGSKNIKDLLSVRRENRYIFRVLPSVDSVSLLYNEGVKMEDIIAVLGPFSEAQNILTMQENDVDYLITKESGKIGGADTKFKAAEELGVKVLLLKREEEEGEPLGEIIKKLRPM